MNTLLLGLQSFPVALASAGKAAGARGGRPEPSRPRVPGCRKDSRPAPVRPARGGGHERGQVHHPGRGTGGGDGR